MLLRDISSIHDANTDAKYVTQVSVKLASSLQDKNVTTERGSGTERSDRVPDERLLYDRGVEIVVLLQKIICYPSNLLHRMKKKWERKRLSERVGGGRNEVNKDSKSEKERTACKNTAFNQYEQTVAGCRVQFIPNLTADAVLTAINHKQISAKYMSKK